MNDRTKKLRNLMSAHNLSTSDVARLLNRQPQTVRVWRCRTAVRCIPDHALALLEAKIARGAV